MTIKKQTRYKPIKIKLTKKVTRLISLNFEKKNNSNLKNIQKSFL